MEHSKEARTQPVKRGYDRVILACTKTQTTGRNVCVLRYIPTGLPNNNAYPFAGDTQHKQKKAMTKGGLISH